MTVDPSAARAHRIVIVDAGFGDGQVETAAVTDLNVTIEYRPSVDRASLLVAACDADGIIVRYTPVPADLIAELPGLRVIGRYGVGVDNVDLAAASAAGIGVVNVPDYCAEEVAQHTLALILAAWRRLPQAAALVADRRWEQWPTLEPIRPLSQCTLGLVGLGRIGREVIRQGRAAFGTVLVFDPYATDLPAGVHSLPDLEQLLAGSDIVSLHCPLTADTQHLINADTLARMRPDSLLVNVSRGPLIDSAALAVALDAGTPSRAALDVLDTEPPTEEHPLLDHPAVLQTPHVAWYSTASLQQLRHLVARRSAEFLLGNPVPTVVNAADLAVHA